MNLYLSDVLNQPAALRSALKELDLDPVKSLGRTIVDRSVNRIILTGMGASFSGLYPAWLNLLKSGFAAIWIDTAELIHHAREMITDQSLVMVCSQSGQSAEVVRLLDLLAIQQPGALLAITNDPESPLGEIGNGSNMEFPSARLLMNAIPEKVPSTRTYLITLAIGELAATAIQSNKFQEVRKVFEDLERTADGIDHYLINWGSAVSMLEDVFSSFETDWLDDQNTITFLGRGRSMASVLSGALCLQELARIPALGFESAQFRHGPLEIADSRLTAFIFHGDGESDSAALNIKLWKDLKMLGSHSWLLSSGGHTISEGGLINIPSYSGIGLPLAEIIPVQLMGYALSLRMGNEPGEFRNIGKVTDKE